MKSAMGLSNQYDTTSLTMSSHAVANRMHYTAMHSILLHLYQICIIHISCHVTSSHECHICITLNHITSHNIISLYTTPISHHITSHHNYTHDNPSGRGLRRFASQSAAASFLNLQFKIGTSLPHMLYHLHTNDFANSITNAHSFLNDIAAS